MVSDLDQARANCQNLLGSFSQELFEDTGRLSALVLRDSEVQNLLYIFVVTLGLPVLKSPRDLFAQELYGCIVD